MTVVPSCNVTSLRLVQFSKVRSLIVGIPGIVMFVNEEHPEYLQAALYQSLVH